MQRCLYPIWQLTFTVHMFLEVTLEEEEKTLFIAGETFEYVSPPNPPNPCGCKELHCSSSCPLPSAVRTVKNYLLGIHVCQLKGN